MTDVGMTRSKNSVSVPCVAVPDRQREEFSRQDLDGDGTITLAESQKRCDLVDDRAVASSR